MVSHNAVCRPHSSSGGVGGIILTSVKVKVAALRSWFKAK